MPKKTFVHRYKWSHINKRKNFKRREKKGTVRKIATYKDGWLYEEVDNARNGI